MKKIDEKTLDSDNTQKSLNTQKLQQPNSHFK